MSNPNAASTIITSTNIHLSHQLHKISKSSWSLENNNNLKLKWMQQFGENAKKDESSKILLGDDIYTLELPSGDIVFLNDQQLQVMVLQH